MTETRSSLLQSLTERGFLHQCTDLEGLDKLALEGPVSAYIGFDCTADSLHVGNLVSIMTLRRLQQAGHRPIVLMGGGTTKVGDPSGKDESRKLLNDDDIARNMSGIRKAFDRYLTFGSGPTDAIMVNNADWLDKLDYIPFLRDYGRHFSINRMLSFDSVQLRLEREQPLSFLEFNYMILQAYDFAELARQQKCRLQLGGSDQWGNIVNGVELARRAEGIEVFGFTTPLITTASGAKMGKSASGAVWINAEKLSPYDFWQYWRNTEDEDVGRFLKLFTDLPLNEIDRVLAGSINDAKKVLANEVTALAHGREAAADAAETARKVFEEGALGDDLPSVTVDLSAGVPAFKLMVLAGLAASNGEARRLIAGGGAYINNVAIGQDDRLVTAADVTGDGVIKLSKGKKHHALVRPGKAGTAKDA